MNEFCRNEELTPKFTSIFGWLNRSSTNVGYPEAQAIYNAV